MACISRFIASHSSPSSHARCLSNCSCFFIFFLFGRRLASQLLTATPQLSPCVTCATPLLSNSGCYAFWNRPCQQAAVGNTTHLHHQLLIGNMFFNSCRTMQPDVLHHFLHVRVFLHGLLQRREHC